MCLVARIFIDATLPSVHLFFFFFNDTATTEIYTLSLHDALPISHAPWAKPPIILGSAKIARSLHAKRSEEHTSELQSRQYLVCRLLLEKKKKNHSVNEESKR